MGKLRKYFLSVIDTDGKSLLNCYGTEEEIVLKTKGVSYSKKIRQFITKNRCVTNKLLKQMEKERDLSFNMFLFGEEEYICIDPNRKNKRGELIKEKRELQKLKNKGISPTKEEIKELLALFIKKNKDVIIKSEIEKVSHLLRKEDLTNLYIGRCYTHLPFSIKIKKRIKNKEFKIDFCYCPRDFGLVEAIVSLDSKTIGKFESRSLKRENVQNLEINKKLLTTKKGKKMLAEFVDSLKELLK